jgi:hypothetical protein
MQYLGPSIGSLFCSTETISLTPSGASLDGDGASLELEELEVSDLLGEE